MPDYRAMPCVLRKRIATEAYYGAWWGEGCPGATSPSFTQHTATRVVGNVEQGANPPSLGAPGAWDWPGVCDRCHIAQVDWTREPCGEGCCEVPRATVHSGTRPVWDTVDGNLHPGDMFWLPHWSPDWCPGQWQNCSGWHLNVVLPNGIHWDIDSRATNCTLPKDPWHRCWVRSGEPPMVTAGKTGNTCSAGAGSIAAGDYHGFLRDGTLTDG